MSLRDPKLLTQDIISSITKILDYTSGITLAQFAANDLTKDAVIRNFAIITEATKRLPKDFKQIHSSVDWNLLEAFGSHEVNSRNINEITLL